MLAFSDEDFYHLVVGHHNDAVVLADVEEARFGDGDEKLVDLC